MDSNELKRLTNEANEVENSILGCKLEIKEANDKLHRLKQKKQRIEQQIELIKSGNRGLPVVSEHAMLRYLERVMGVDLEHIKAQIVTDKFKANFTAMPGNGEYPFTDAIKIRAVVKNGVVTTLK